MDYSKKSNYSFSIDALRVISIIAVVCIHSTTKTLQTLDHNITIAWFTLFLNQASRFAVPLFFLISGYVLELNNREELSFGTFFKKRASRIVIPFIFWSLLYFYIGWGFTAEKFVGMRFVTDLIFGKASYHLYFIPTLIIFYLAFPVLHKAINVLKKPQVLTLILIVQACLLYYDYYVKQLPLESDLRIAILSFAMFIIGMVSSSSRKKILDFVKGNLYMLILLTTTLLGIIFLHVYDITTIQKTNSYIYNQYSPLNYMYTLLFASVMYYFFEKTQIFRKFFMTLSRLSFFVFFIHVLILNLLWDNVIKNLISQNGNSFLKTIWFDPLVLIVVASVSFGIAYIVHKIPVLSKITG